MGNLTEKFIRMLADGQGDPEISREVAEMVLSAPITPETTGLLAWLYHEGIGVKTDIGESFRLAAKAAFDGGDGLGYFLLGYMCDNAETPDQAEGGPRQKYDHYDAARFYSICADIDSRWRVPARLWLGDYYMDMAAGGDPDVAVEYYESIADDNSEAAGKLSDYFWNLIMPEYLRDEEWEAKLFKWTSTAAQDEPENFAYRMGWIYADGLGCDIDSLKAAGCFEEAFINGDPRGAEAVAQCYREYLEDHPELTEEEKSVYEARIEKWEAKADSAEKEKISDLQSEVGRASGGND